MTEKEKKQLEATEAIVEYHRVVVTPKEEEFEPGKAWKGMDYDDFEGITSEDEYVPSVSGALFSDDPQYPTCFRELVDVNGLNTVWVNESDFIEAWDRFMDYSKVQEELTGLKASVKAAEHFMPPNIKLGSARLYCEETLLDVMSGFSSFNTR